MQKLQKDFSKTTQFKLNTIIQRVGTPVEVETDKSYTQIGIRSHGKGIFIKEPVTGLKLGNKRVFWVEPNCFIVNIVFAWERAVAQTTGELNGLIASHRFPMYKLDESKVNLDYFTTLFLTTRGQLLLELASPGGAGRNKTLGQKEFLNLEVSLPNIEVQKYVASFLKLLNRKIQKQKTKIELLKEQKKGYMQKVFKQEIRFKDENGEDYPTWKKSKLKPYLIQHSEKTTLNNQYPPLTSSRNGIFLQKEYFNHQVASIDNTGYNIVPRGYFTYRHMSDDVIFKFNINNIVDNGIVSTLYPVFTTTNEMDSQYLKYFLNESDDFKKYGLLQKQGGSRTYMYFSKLVEFEAQFPTINEQKKISKFLSNFDRRIQVEQQKLETLQEQKKGFMQQMFI
ncbi:restriction endonuclease subunit S [Priestia megaterium]|uniref:restriction endonuclease subunit S n=1 Tax=Priestia megaterium TaxID=1404 RepID=UPI0022B87CA3|nr:restriction endonuclease subunit S [Priestia megaterium]MCZ8495576.1 restriction endonuclease subunit S [Priestia megaterium]